MDAIFHRVSIRRYADRPVEQAKVEQMLRAAMAAPSAGNQQPWEYYVVTDPQKKAELAACSPYARCAENAPLVFVACCRKDVRMPEYAQIDTSASVENLLLEADAQGLGAVWLGIAPLAERMRQVEAALAMPATLEAFALIACGYPAEQRPQQDRYDPARVHFV